MLTYFRKLAFTWAICIFFGVDGDANAMPITIGGPWQEFSFTFAPPFDVPPVWATGCFPYDPDGLDCVGSSGGNSVFAGTSPWIVIVPPDSVVRLIVTDAFERGNFFEIFDNGISIGLTPPVLPEGSCGDNPVFCLADPFVSHATFPLAAGVHELMIRPDAVFGLDEEFNSRLLTGAAYFLVVPEPTILSLMAVGLVVVLTKKRKVIPYRTSKISYRRGV